MIPPHLPWIWLVSLQLWIWGCINWAVLPCLLICFKHSCCLIFLFLLSVHASLLSDLFLSAFLLRDSSVLSIWAMCVLAICFSVFLLTSVCDLAIWSLCLCVLAIWPVSVTLLSDLCDLAIWPVSVIVLSDLCLCSQCYSWGGSRRSWKRKATCQ